MSKHKKKQWHPQFAQFLRLQMQHYYEVRTTVPVGDAPREADIVLLRRTTEEPTPFTGLWSNLTLLNLIEFKGPTVDARLHDLDLLVELGLGIHRRLNEEQQNQGEDCFQPEQVSFWYIVRSLGRRFVPVARLRLGQLDEVRPGLWRSQILQRLVFLVSSETLGSEVDAVPLHLLVQRSPEEERELAELIATVPKYWHWYASPLSQLHPEVWKEVQHMARTKGKGLEWDLTGVLEDLGMEGLVEKLGVKDVIKAVGVNRAVKQLGVKQVMEAVGPEKIIEEMGVDWLIAKLPAAQLKKLKERLK
jgi:hypothetical protein